MTARRHTFCTPEVQAFENRVLLSCATLAKPAGPAALVQTDAFATKGTITGGFRHLGTSIRLSNLGGSLKGTGAVKGSGALNLDGTVILGGQINVSNKPGNRKVGTLTLEVLPGSQIPQGKNPSLTLNFQVTRATGVYASALNLFLNAQVKFQSQGARGTFTAKFS